MAVGNFNGFLGHSIPMPFHILSNMSPTINYRQIMVNVISKQIIVTARRQSSVK
jgi:hypothetical protein